MAGEVFIARQDTLETVKVTVDGIDSGVKQTNNALGNFSGGGTDTVKTELQTLKDSVAQLQTKSDQLQSLVEQLMNKGGGLNFKYTEKTAELGEDTSVSHKSISSGIAFFYNAGGEISLSIGREFRFGENLSFAFFPQNTTIILTNDSRTSGHRTIGYFYEFI